MGQTTTEVLSSRIYLAVVKVLFRVWISIDELSIDVNRIDQYKLYFFYFSGRREGRGVSRSIWAEEVDAHSSTFEGPNRKTMSRKMAQSPESWNQENRLDRSGRPNHC